MKKILIILIIPILFGFKTGQEIDEKKMNRDLEIAKNILATLIKTGSNSFYGGTSIEASYIKDYGVVFTIPEHLVYFHSGPGAVLAMPELPAYPDFDMEVDVHIDEEINEQEKIIIEREIKKAKEEAKVAKREAERSHREARKALAEARELDDFYISSGETSEIDWEEIMITFLADYADLIGQLQPNEKIVINQKSPYDDLIVVWGGTGYNERLENKNSSISAEVYRKDVKAYKSGKIKLEEFKKRVKIKKKEPQKKVADLEMFASIFDRYYSYDLSETFYSEGKPRYEVLEGFGAVFHIKASSASSSKSRVQFYRQGRARQMEVESDETNDAELYPKFKDDIKAFMLDYGRTIRSLNDDDKVMLEIKINSCRECNIPKTLEVTSEISLLKQYDQQKITRDKALAAIEMKEQF